MDGSSFSEEEEDSSRSFSNRGPEGRRQRRMSCCSVSSSRYFQGCREIYQMWRLLFPSAVPKCVVTKELLTDGLKVLISKDDELLYAARVHTLELPDM